MKKTSVDFGCYYNSIDNKELVKAITRASNPNAEDIILYCKIDDGGFASALMYMIEKDFVATFINWVAYTGLVQLVAHLSYIQEVVGSSPSSRTTERRIGSIPIISCN